MIRADLFLFGYFVFSIADEDKVIAADILLGADISASFDRKNRFIVPFRNKDAVSMLFEGKVKYAASEPLGLYGFILKNKKRLGVILGLFIAAVMLFVSSGVVWDVRIEGDTGGSEEEILAELSEAGLSVGARWSKLDKNQIEINMLAASKSVAWVNINRRGAVAYVRIGEKTVYEEEEKPCGYANVVAARDCVIEEIIVESGYPMVKKGESVREGEVIISGVIPTELGGGFCYASGTVIGRYNDSISVNAERKVSEKIYKESRLADRKIIFFGIPINIFKKYGQLSDSCDIIEETKYLTLGKRLPISIRKLYFKEYEIFEKELSDDELVSLAGEQLRLKLLDFLSDKEARRMVTSGEFSEDGYKMICDAVVCSDVAKIQEFKVE